MGGGRSPDDGVDDDDAGDGLNGEEPSVEEAAALRRKGLCIGML